MTDRVVAPDGRLIREWKRTHDLYSHACRPGSKDGALRVLAVTDCEDHFEPLIAVGEALSCLASIEGRDYEFDADEHQMYNAVKAEVVRGAAWQALNTALQEKLLDEDVYKKMVGLLRRGSLPRVEFSKDWEYASILYAPMTVKGLRHIERDVIQSIFGEVESTQASMRKDRSRARDFMNKVQNEGKPGVKSTIHAPCIEIVQKYVTEVVRHFSSTPVPVDAIDLMQRISVTPCVSRVTSRPQKSGHEKTRKTPQAVTLESVFAGFPVATRPGSEVGR